MAEAPVLPPRTLPETAISRLRDLFGERLSLSAAVRDQHGHDESYYPGVPPDAVAFPHATEEVAAAVRICAEHDSPVIPFGTGTALEGGVCALAGGLCLDLSGMNRVVRVSAEDMDATVEAGVTRKRLNSHLRDTGLFFPIDPGADASLGGMTSTRASGTNAVRYGTMRDNVLGLTVVTAAGEIVRTGGRARKSAAGYDLTRLFVGAEGTLGVVTEITLKLSGVPEAMSAAVCAFDSVKGAVDTVIQTIQCGVPVARIELVDPLTIDAINRYSKLDLPVAPHLFFEFHGSKASVAEQAETAGAFAADNGGRGFAWAATPEERTRLWQARHDAYYASLALRPGCKGWSTDVCVPISRLADCVMETRADLEESRLLAPMVGHVGDGNFHVIYLVDPADVDEVARARGHADRIVERALAMGGTCTGEHGIGFGKMKFLEREAGPGGMALMRSIKQAFDPRNIMNPGKIVRYAAV